jgi:hypothetical protein
MILCGIVEGVDAQIMYNNETLFNKLVIFLEKQSGCSPSLFMNLRWQCQACT